jgi:hypothetical protein
VLAAGLAAGVVGCGEDRPRPAPPALVIHFQHDSVGTPDSLRGTIVVTDNVGIDSLWVTFAAEPEIGVDGGFNFSFEAPFLFAVDSGLLKGTRLPFELRARDIAGYSDVLDTFVVVK